MTEFAPVLRFCLGRRMYIYVFRAKTSTTGTTSSHFGSLCLGLAYFMAPLDRPNSFLLLSLLADLTRLA
jgi:hypothetical protein